MKKGIIRLELGNEKGNYWITNLEVLKKGEPRQLERLKHIAGKARLCGCGDVCVAVIDIERGMPPRAR